MANNNNKQKNKKQNVKSDIKGEFKLGFRAITKNGKSDRLGDDNEWHKGSHTGNGNGTFKFRPDDLHEDAIGWEPLVTTRDSKTGKENKYKITKNKGSGHFDPDEDAPVYSDNASKADGTAGTSMVADTEADVDETGTTEPTDSPAIPERIDLNTSGLTPGNHWVKAAMFVGEDGEGPVSLPRRVRIQAGEGLRIHAPKWFNKLDNPEIALSEANEEQDVNQPVDWTLSNDPESAVTVTSTQPNVIDVEDESDTEDDEELFTTASAHLDDPNIDRYSVGFMFKFKQKEHGSILIYMYEYDEAGALIGAQLVEALGANLGRKLVGRQYFLSRRDEDVAGPLLLKLNELTGTVQFVALSKGTGKQKKRWFYAQFSQFAVVPGWAIPDPSDPGDVVTDPGVDPDETDPDEYQKYIRPLGGYCVVVNNPKDGPVALDAAIQDWTVFQDYTYGGWNVTQDATMVNQLASGAAIVSRYGVHMSKTLVGTNDNARNYLRKSYNLGPRLTIGADFFLSAFDQYGLDLSAIQDTNGSFLARTYLTGTGDLMLKAANNLPVVVASGFDDAMMLSVELSVDTEDGIVTVHYGPNEDTVVGSYTLIDVDYSNYAAPKDILVGASFTGINRNALFVLKLGRLMVSDRSVKTRYRQLPGNYIEYFGPWFTPFNPEYGPTGMRIPAKPNQTYNISAYAWYQGMAADSDALSIRAVDAKGKTLRTYQPVIKDMAGDKKYWQRHQAVILTPFGTDHIEFYANNLGQGRLKIFGIQVSEGSELKLYSTLRQRKGDFSIYFNNRQAELEPDDPMWELGRVKKLRTVLVAGVDSANVSYFCKYRVGNTFEELDAQPYTYDWSHLATNKNITEVRIDMSSMVDGETPEIRSVELDVVRFHSQICREDGTEYKGGTIASEITTPSEPPHYENIDLATGGRIAAEWGSERVRAIKCKLTVFRKSTAEEIMKGMYHIIETPTHRYTVIADSPIEFTPQPGSRKYFKDDREFFQVETADLAGWILREEVL